MRMVVIVVMLVPVAIRVPPVFIFIPPAVAVLPTVLPRLVQFVPRMVGLLAVPAVMLRRFVQAMICFRDAFLAFVFVRAAPRSPCK